MIDKHSFITIDKFNGRFDSGDNESCPVDHFLDEGNLRFDYGKVSSRHGTSLDLAVNFAINRWHIYKRTGEADRKIILDASGNLFDSAVSLVSPILTIAAMVDFSMITINNRACITPHDRNRGIANESIYVYQGSGIARKAAGDAPTGFTLGVADSTASGNWEAGERLFAVVYEMDTGYITKPGPAEFTRHHHPGEKAVDFTNISVGPTGTIARRIVSSRRFSFFPPGISFPSTYDGNQLTLEYFYVPGGVISDNVTTELLGVSCYDSELINSADYLFDQLSTIPAGVGIGLYRNYLITWGSNANPLTIYVSKASDYESVDSVEGIVQVRNDGSGGVYNCIESREILYIHKERRTYYVQDNNESPAYWIVNPIDQSVGTTCFGIGKILGQDGALLDYYVLADRSALRISDGTFKINLGAKIQNIWNRINQVAFPYIQVVIDSSRSLLYISLPLDDAVTPLHVLMGDFTDGLTPGAIKWSLWNFPDAPRTIGVDVNSTTDKVDFEFSAHLSGNVYKIDETALNDYGTAISWFYRTAYIGFNSKFGTSQFVASRSRVRGVGDIQTTIYGLDDNSPKTSTNITLAISPGKSFRNIFNYNTELASFKFIGGFNNGDYFHLNRITIFGSPLWDESPS